MVTKVEFSHWATPIVPVPKKDGTFRICGDFKVTVNPALEVDQHPIPKPEDIFASLAGGHHFSTLDLSQAYQQLLLDDKSKELVTINTLVLDRLHAKGFHLKKEKCHFLQTTVEDLGHIIDAKVSKQHQSSVKPKLRHEHL